MKALAALIVTGVLALLVYTLAMLLGSLLHSIFVLPGLVQP